MKKILIAGATGTAGKTIATTLISSGDYTVYGLTHKEENRSVLEDLGGIPVLADLTNREQSLQVIDRIKPEIIISSVMGSGENASEQELRMGDNLIRIAKETGVSTFVYISVYRSDKKTGVPHFEVKSTIENLLKLSGLKYLVIRPASFMDSLFMPWFLQAVKEKNTLVSPMASDTKISYIHTRDIAEMILHALQQRLMNETYIIGGQTLSIDDIRDILSEKMNVEIGYHQLPPEQLKQMAGNEIARMVDYFNHSHFVVDENILPAGYTPSLRLFKNEINQYL